MKTKIKVYKVYPDSLTKDTKDIDWQMKFGHRKEWFIKNKENFQVLKLSELIKFLKKYEVYDSEHDCKIIKIPMSHLEKELKRLDKDG